jgi:hypothetical protein
MPTRELVVRPIPSGDAASWPRLVTLLAVALDRYLIQQPPTVDLFRDLRIHPDVKDNAKGPTE